MASIMLYSFSQIFDFMSLFHNNKSGLICISITRHWSISSRRSDLQYTVHRSVEYCKCMNVYSTVLRVSDFNLIARHRKQVDVKYSSVCSSEYRYRAYSLEKTLLTLLFALDCEHLRVATPI